MNIYGFINVLKTLRFFNIKFGYLSEVFISKIGKRTTLIALSHIHVSAHVSMKMSIRRGLSRILLERRMYHVRVTFLLRPCGVSVTYLYSYGISLSYVRRINAYRCMCYVRVTYVWRMKCTRDVSTAYVLRSIIVCGVSVLYQLLFNTYKNKRLCSLCSCNLHIIVINYQRSKMPPEKSR